MLDVLIADDEPKIRRGLRSWIEESDGPFRVCGEAEDGRQALDLALRLKPRLVLADINMPRGGGLELIRQLKASLPETLVIVISGYDTFEYVREAFKQEVFDYLLKPVPRSDFMRILLQAAAELEGSAGQEESMEGDDGEPSPLARDIRSYLLEHYSDRELSLQKTAEQFRLSKSYLSRLMKMELNASFVDYLTALRIEKAKELLRQPGEGLKMHQIAQKVGFSSQHYFSRVFKAHTALSPLEYRRRG